MKKEICNALNMRFCLIIPFLIFYGIVNAQLQPAHDTTYGIQGVAHGPWSNAKGSNANVMNTIQPDGKILMSGYSKLGCSYSISLTRLNENGTPDTSFGDQGKVILPFAFDVYDRDELFIDQFYYFPYFNYGTLKALTNGKILLTGSLDGISISLIQLNMDGSVDLTFGKNGFVEIGKKIEDQTDFGRSFDVQANGKIVIANGTTIIRLNPNGTTDYTFENNIKLDILDIQHRYFQAIAIQKDGKIIASGNSTLRLNSDGTIDTTFGVKGVYLQQFGVRFIGIANDKLIILSDYGPLAQLNMDGTVDSTFNGGNPLNSPFNVIADLKIVAGKIVVAGMNASYDSIVFNSINKYGVISTLHCPMPFRASINNFEVKENGTILCMGTTPSQDFYTIAFNPDGAINLQFGKNGISTTDLIHKNNTMARGILIQSDNKAVILGESFVARLDQNGNPDKTFNNGKTILQLPEPFNIYSWLDVKIQSGRDKKIYISGNKFDTAHIVRLLPEGALDTTFGKMGTVMFPYRIKNIAFASDGKILISGDTLKRLLDNGTIDNTMQATFGCANMALQPDGNVLILSEEKILSRVTPNMELDPSFGNNGFLSLPFLSDDAEPVMALQADQKILIGGSQLIGYYNSNFKISRIHSNGTIDSSFNAAVSSHSVIHTTKKLRVQSNGNIIMFGELQNHDHSVGVIVYSLKKDGSLDSSFNKIGYIILPDYSTNYPDMDVQDDGKILLATTPGCNIGAVRLIPSNKPPVVTNNCSITHQPVSVTTCIGQAANFNISAEGTGLSYQWQEYSLAGPFHSIKNGDHFSGVNTDSLTIKSTNLHQNKYKYRCIVTSACGSDTSAGKPLNVIHPEIISNPTEESACLNTKAYFSVKASGKGIAYQWQRKRGTGDFFNLINEGGFQNVTTAKLTINGAKSYMNNNTFRCILSIDCNPNYIIYTEPAILHVGSCSPNEKVTILQPGNEDGKDAMVYKFPGSEDVNFGNNPAINAVDWTFNGVEVTMRTFLEFDLSSIPGNAVIVSSKLSLYKPNTDNQHYGDNDFYIQRVTESWTESGITWNNQPAVTTANQVLVPVSYSVNQNYENINVTSLVKDMIDNGNHGFMLKLKIEEIYRKVVLASSDDNNSQHPKLEVRYTIPSSASMKYAELSTEESEVDIDGLIVAPNPSSNQTSIHLSQPVKEECHWTVYNSNGKIMSSGIINSNDLKFYLNTSLYPSGMYLVNLNKNGKTLSSKFVVSQ